MNAKELQALRDRLGDSYIQRRLQAEVSAKEQDTMSRFIGLAYGGPMIGTVFSIMRLVKRLLRVTRLYRWGIKNALALQVRENTLSVYGLPYAFEGLRVLQLSDLHLDGYEGFGRHVAEFVKPLDFDVCVITGDFRFSDNGQYPYLVEEILPLAPALGCRLGVYGIMGNHDYIEMVPLLENQGVRMLINEAVRLRRDGADLWLVGIDDPHFYQTHDFDVAMRDVPLEAKSILLAHSPEVIPEASALNIDAYLAGHTHGGQICFPGGWTPYVNVSCPRAYAIGAWQYEHMMGYTSRGTGASGIFVRYFCPPEVTIHTLKRA